MGDDFVESDAFEVITGTGTTVRREPSTHDTATVAFAVGLMAMIYAVGCDPDRIDEVVIEFTKHEMKGELNGANMIKTVLECIRTVDLRHEAF